jgi:undecaprenyl-diphosphatase
MLGAALLSRTFKLLLHRQRPHFWDLFYPLPSDYSFPSGHALFSLTFALAIIILAWNSRWRWGVLLVGSSFAIAIAWTRLYLGVHYPSDIFGGWLIAIALTISMGKLFGLPNPTKRSESLTAL